MLGALKRFRRRPLALAGTCVVLAVIGAAAFAPLLSSYSPNVQSLYARLQPPSPAHWLGTDGLGSDVFSRLLFGARVSLVLGTAATAITVLIGVALGAASGYLGGMVDWILMRFTDVFMTIPVLFLVLFVVAALGASTLNTILVVGAVYWPTVARVVRGQMLGLRSRDFVEAAKGLGASMSRILVRHLLPNAISIVIVQTTLTIATAILAESALSFLGLGVPPPTPSWGNMLTEGRLQLSRAWWIATSPGLAIFLTVLSLNVVGDGLRDALDPRLQ